MSLPRYGEYKDSGVHWLGTVPTHWTVMPIRLAARLESGHTPSRSRPDWWEDCSVPWFTLADVSQIRRDGANVIYDTKEKVSELGLLNSSARRLPAGTVMLSRTASVGFAAIMGVDMATTQDFANWVCGPSLRPRFLLHVFRAMHGEFARLMMGSTHSTIYMPDIAALRFALPPVKEQDAVVDFLDRETGKIDALVSEQEKLLTLLAEKRKATISRAVTKGLNPDAPMKDSGVKWLGQVPEHWVAKRLKHISPFITVGIVVNPSEYVSDEGLPFIYGGDITEGFISERTVRRITLETSQRQAKTMLNPGDLVTVRVGAPGVTAVVPESCAGGNCASVMLMRRGAFVSNWLCYAMNSRMVRSQVEVVQYGAAQEQFNISHAINFWVATPPTMEQEAIAAFLDAETAHLDALTAEATRAIALLKERRTALISAAVTGKIDVRHEAA